MLAGTLVNKEDANCMRHEQKMGTSVANTTTLLLGINNIKIYVKNKVCSFLNWVNFYLSENCNG